jgi:acetyl esterase/lipase
MAGPQDRQPARAAPSQSPRNSEDLLLLPSPPANARIPYGPEPSNFGDLFLPAGSGPHPIVLMIHGGFWRNRYDLEHIGHLCAALAAQGLAIWSIEYRRLGDRGGGWPGTFLDVTAAALHLRNIAGPYHLDLGRVIVMGHSAGGHLAFWVAGLARIPRGDPLAVSDPLELRAAISLAGVLDLKRAAELRLSSGATEELMGSPSQYPERYALASPIELVPLGVRQFLFHGQDDDTVPFEISARYAEMARVKGDRVTWVPLPHTGHYELIDPESHVWPQLLDVVSESLRHDR